MERVGQRDGIEATIGPHIAPPHPRRHLGHAAQLQNAVGGTTGVVAFYHYLTIVHPDAEAVVVALALHDADAGILGSHGFVGRHHLHVVSKHLQGLLHHWRHLALHLIGHGVVAVVPHHIGGRYCQRAECKDGSEEETFHRRAKMRFFLFLVDDIQVFLIGRIPYLLVVRFVLHQVDAVGNDGAHFPDVLHHVGGLGLHHDVA